MTCHQISLGARKVTPDHGSIMGSLNVILHGFIHGSIMASLDVMLHGFVHGSIMALSDVMLHGFIHGNVAGASLILLDHGFTHPSLVRHSTGMTDDQAKNHF